MNISINCLNYWCETESVNSQTILGFYVYIVLGSLEMSVRLSTIFWWSQNCLFLYIKGVHYGSIKKIKKSDNCISYDIFGTKTGRLSTKKNSFPIMTLNKSYRAILKPKNDLFLELDYNAAELRTLLALSGHTQPDQDIHEWNMKNVYGDRLNREESKKRIFSFAIRLSNEN